MTEPPPSRLEQLQRALDLGAIDRDTYAAAVAGLMAQLTGDGAIAQGPGARAAGAGGVVVGGNNTGNINTGTRRNQRRPRP